MVQVFVFCERNYKGAAFSVKRSTTVSELIDIVGERHTCMRDDWKGKSLLLGGRAHTVVRGDGPALSQTVDIATGRALGFTGSKFMVRMFSYHTYSDSYQLAVPLHAGNTVSAWAAESRSTAEANAATFRGTCAQR